VLSRYSPDAFRYFYLSTHYRKQIDYTEDAMMNAEQSARRLRNTLDLMEEALRAEGENLDYAGRDETFLAEVQAQRRRFEEAMDDDLDTHGALDALHALSRAINEYVAASPNKGVLINAYTVYRALLDALGLFEGRRGEMDDLTESLIEIIVKVRERLRAEGNYELSDGIRADLAKIGVILGDGAERTSWKIERR